MESQVFNREIRNWESKISKNLLYVTLGIINSQEARNRSVLQVITPELNDCNGYPARGGLYDPRLGTTDQRIRCSTCGNGPEFCPGHEGHLELAFPIYHPEYISSFTIRVLTCVCFACSHPLYYEENEKLCNEAQNIIKHTSAANRLVQLTNLCKKRRFCKSCQFIQPSYQYSSARATIIPNWRHTSTIKGSQSNAYNLQLTNEKKSAAKKKDVNIEQKKNEFINKLQKQVFTAREAQLILSNISEKVCTELGFINTKASDGILTALVIPAPTIRPYSIENSKTRTNSNLTSKLVEIIKVALELQKEVQEWIKTSVDPKIIQEQMNDEFGLSPMEINDFNKAIGAQREQWLTLIDSLPNEPVPASVMSLVDRLQIFIALYMNNGARRSTKNSKSENITIIDRREEEEEEPNTLKNELNKVNKIAKRTIGPVMINGESLRERWGGKKGRFRSGLCGKRVEGSARSVITPDPNITVDELGVPIQIGKILTTNERVNKLNYHEMIKCVRRGPKHNHGAQEVIFEKTQEVINLSHANIDLNEIANRITDDATVIVERNMRDGDDVLFNRQPSLHRQSIMSHFARIFDCKSFKLNPEACEPYGADFDGDEMNMHVPRSLIVRAEMRELMNVCHQIISVATGNPEFPLKQDVITGIYLITRKNVFFTREDAMQLIFTSFKQFVDTKFVMPVPCILKPQKLWSGKQLYSMIIPRIVSLQLCVRQLKTQSLSYDHILDQEERYVHIENGQILCGRLCKNVLGSGSNSLIRLITSDANGKEAIKFLGDSLSLAVSYLSSYRGHTIGYTSLQVNDVQRQQINHVLLPLEKYLDEIEKLRYDRNLSATEQKRIENHILNVFDQMPEQLYAVITMNQRTNIEEENPMDIMSTSGARGNSMNTTQLSGAAGIFISGGKRPGAPLIIEPPRSITTSIKSTDNVIETPKYGTSDQVFFQKNLPSHKINDPSIQNRGYERQSYIDGVTPQGEFAIIAAGRESLINTTETVSGPGYYARRSDKNLESYTIDQYGCVVNAHKHIIMYSYGNDGIDPSKSERVKCRFLELYLNHEKEIFDIVNQESGHTEIEISKMISLAKMYLEQHECSSMFHSQLPDSIKDHRTTLYISAPIHRMLDQMFPRKKEPESRTIETFDIYFSILNRFCEEDVLNDRIRTLKRAIRRKRNGIDYFVTECLHLKLWLRYQCSIYEIALRRRMSPHDFEYFLNTVFRKVGNTQIAPGEMVGSTASSSMSRPNVQSMLDSKHFKNKASSQTRTKEVIEVSPNPKYSSMYIYLQGAYAFCPECRSKQVHEKLLKKLCTQLEFLILGSIVLNASIQIREPTSRDPIILSFSLTSKSVSQYKRRSVSKSVPQNESTYYLMPMCIEYEIDTQSMPDNLIQCVEAYVNAVVTMECTENEKTILRVTPYTSKLITVQEENSKEFRAFYKEMIRLQQDLMAKVILGGIPGIQKAKLMCESQNNEYWIKTEGTSLRHVLMYPFVDPYRTWSDNFYEVAHVMGIGCTKLILAYEIQNHVCGNMYLDPRHIDLICEAMTRRAVITAMNRHGMNKNFTSYQNEASNSHGFLVRSSFEQTPEVLLNAALYNEKDPVRGVTESVIIGRLAPIGTAICDFLLDPEYKLNIDLPNGPLIGNANKLIHKKVVNTRYPKSRPIYVPPPRLQKPVVPQKRKSFVMPPIIEHIEQGQWQSYSLESDSTKDTDDPWNNTNNPYFTPYDPSMPRCHSESWDPQIDYDPSMPQNHSSYDPQYPSM